MSAPSQAVRGNLFFALPAPPALARAFEGVQARWERDDRQAWRWVAPHLFHLTLIFLGPREKSELEAVHLAGTSAAQVCAPFTLQARGLGAFPSARKPTRVLWAGLGDSDRLRTLVESLAEGLKAGGLSFDSKTFKAHVTLARRRSSHQRWAPPLAEAWSERDWGEWPVDELVLLRSQLGGGPPVYHKQAVWRLNGEA